MLWPARSLGYLLACQVPAIPLQAVASVTDDASLMTNVPFSRFVDAVPAKDAPKLLEETLNEICPFSATPSIGPLIKHSELLLLKDIRPLIMRSWLTTIVSERSAVWFEMDSRMDPFQLPETSTKDAPPVLVALSPLVQA